MIDEQAQPPRRWYESLWVTLLAGYVFAPLGLYLMWRYRQWPLPVKVLFTGFALVAFVVGTLLTPRLLGLPRLS